MSARARSWIGLGVIMLTVSAAGAAQLEAGSALRAVVVFAAFLLVPGWVLVTFLDSGPPAAMLGLAIGLSLAVDGLVSLALLWAGLFADAPAVAAIIGILALPLLIRDCMRQSQSPRTKLSRADPKT